MRYRRGKSINNENGYAGDDSSSDDGSMSSYQNLPHEDGPFGGNGADNDNVDLGGHNEQNDTEESYSENMCEFIAGAHNVEDYHGLSDMDIGHGEDTLEETDHYSENKTQEIAGDHTAHECHGKSYMDIGHDKEEAVERYEKTMGMKFPSEEAAYVFYNSYAKDRGFSIRRGRVKKGKGPSGVVRLRRFVCSREGKRQAKFLTMDGRTRRPRAESRCNCKAQFIVKFDRSSGDWVASRFVDQHNHTLARPDEVPFLRSHRKIPEYLRAEILALEADGVKKSTIMRTLISRSGSYNNVGFVGRDLYNMCSREKRKLINNRADGHKSFVNEDAHKCEVNTVAVGDPIKVSTKGARKQNTQDPAQEKKNLDQKWYTTSIRREKKAASVRCMQSFRT